MRQAKRGKNKKLIGKINQNEIPHNKSGLKTFSGFYFFGLKSLKVLWVISVSFGYFL